MANSSVPITPGTGTDIDTRTTTTDGNHRQVIVIGDPATDAGVAPVDVAYGLAVDVKRAQPVSSAFHVITAAASANAQNVKAGAGTLRGFSFFNATDVPLYLKFHNTAGTPTPGSGVVRTFGIQAGVHISVTIPGGLTFATGIAITIVKGIADSDTSQTAVNEGAGEIYYE
jgi:hypothetical protein